MGSAVSSASSVGGSVGGAIGGIIGQGQASGDASQAQSEASLANQIMQQMAAVPDISKPLVLDQYRQAGVLTPAVEQQISLGQSQASQVKANPALVSAQNQALQQMATRSQTGLTASDRAAFNQLQSQVGANTQGRLGQIQQQEQAQTGGQGSNGASLAAKLSAAQGGANSLASQSDQLAAQASNNALQATAQYGNMAGSMNSQQYQQQQSAAKSADAFRQFDVQNQVAQQQRNVASSNAAQQYNLNNAQNTSNANVTSSNTEAQNELQRQAQQWQMQYQQAAGQSAAAAGYGNVLSGQAQQIAQAGANLGAGLGGGAAAAASSAGGSGSGGGSGGGGGDEEDDMFRGGEAGYAAGGNVQQQPQSAYPAFSAITPIQTIGAMAATQSPKAQYVMPARGTMAPITVPTVNIAKGSTKAKNATVPMGTASDSTDADITGANNPLVQQGDATTGQVMAGGPDDGIADKAGLMGLLGDSSGAPSEQQAYSGGRIQNRQDFRTGGKVPGKAPLQGDKPENDIVPAKLSPGEIVLPRSIAMKLKGAHDADFAHHLNNIVGPFIRKSQKMADGGEVDQSKATPDKNDLSVGDEINMYSHGKDVTNDYDRGNYKAMKQLKSESNLPMYAKGGEVEHDKRNLVELSKAFAKFLKEEGREKSYADGGQVDNNEPMKKTDYEASQEAIARKQALLKNAGIDPNASDFELGEEAAESHRRGYDDGGEVDSDDSDDDGISDNASMPQLGGNNAGIQAAAQSDAGMSKPLSGAPPPRGNMDWSIPVAPKSSGGGGGGGGMGAMAAMMADGGQVPASTDSDSAWNRLTKTLKDQFNPQPPPPPKSDDESKEDKYAAIRHQNLVNAGEAEGEKDDVKFKGGAIKEQKFEDGGESQPPQPDTSDDTDDEPEEPVYADKDSSKEEEPFIVRAKPNSDKELDKIGSEEFEDDKDSSKDKEVADADDEDDTDRSKDPADLDSVKNDDEEKDPEEEDEKTKKVIADFDKAEHPDDDAELDRKVASSDDGTASDADITNKDVQVASGEDPNATDDDEQPVKSVEEKMSNFQRKLQRAQRQRQSILAGAQGAKYGALIAAGLAGHGAKPAGAEYFNNDALAATPVQNIKEQAEGEMNDPDSPVSQFYRQRLKESLGTTVAPDVSAAGLKALFPQVTKVVGQDYAAYQKQLDRENKLKIAGQNNQTKKDVTNTRVGAQRDIAGARNETAKTIAGQKNDIHISDKDKGEQDKITKELNSLQASSRSVLGASSMSKMRSQRLKDLLNTPGATPQDLNLAASELNTAVTNTSTVAGAKGLEYHNLQTGLAGLIQKYTSNPSSPDVPEIKAHMAQIADRMSAISDDIINTNANAIKAGHTDFINKYPDRWNNMLQANTGNGQGSPTAPAAPNAPQSAPRMAAPGGKTVVKKGYNAKTNQTQFIYSDGTKETKPGKL
jgi:hypothetical protein